MADQPFDASNGADYVYDCDLRLDGASTLSLHRNGADVHVRIQHHGEEDYAVAVVDELDVPKLIDALDRLAPAAAPVPQPTEIDRVRTERDFWAKEAFRLAERDGWAAYGTHQEVDYGIKFDGTDECGEPLWERAVPQGTEDSDYREQVARALNEHGWKYVGLPEVLATPGSYARFHATLDAVLRVPHPDTAEAARLRQELADLAEAMPCSLCDGTGIAPEERFGRDSDGAPMVDGDQPCPDGCPVRRDIAYLRDAVAEYDRHAPACLRERDQLRTDLRVRTGELADVNAELARWRSGQRRHSWPVVESVPDCGVLAGRLLHAQGEGAEWLDELLRKAARRLVDVYDAASALLAERDRLQESRFRWAEATAEMEKRLASAVVLPEDWRGQFWDVLDSTETKGAADTGIAKLVRSWRGAPVEAEPRHTKCGPACPAPTRDEVVEEFAATWDGVDRTPPTLAQTRTGTDWCPNCREEAGTNRFGDDGGTQRCGTCGSELETAYLWKRGDLVTWSDDAGTYRGTVILDEQPGHHVAVQYLGVEHRGLVAAGDLRAPVRGVDWQPGCNRPDCESCQRAGRPCGEHEGGADGFCPRCGWHGRWHSAPAAQPEPQGEPRVWRDTAGVHWAELRDRPGHVAAVVDGIPKVFGEPPTRVKVESTYGPLTLIAGRVSDSKEEQ